MKHQGPLEERINLLLELHQNCSSSLAGIIQQLDSLHSHPIVKSKDKALPNQLKNISRKLQVGLQDMQKLKSLLYKI